MFRWRPNNFVAPFSLGPASCHLVDRKFTTCPFITQKNLFLRYEKTSVANSRMEDAWKDGRIGITSETRLGKSDALEPTCFVYRSTIVYLLQLNNFRIRSQKPHLTLNLALRLSADFLLSQFGPSCIVLCIT